MSHRVHMALEILSTEYVQDTSQACPDWFTGAMAAKFLPGQSKTKAENPYDQLQCQNLYTQKQALCGSRRFRFCAKT